MTTPRWPIMAEWSCQDNDDRTHGQSTSVCKLHKSVHTRVARMPELARIKELSELLLKSCCWGAAAGELLLGSCGWGAAGGY
jgi:hypothetical protein